MGCEISALFNSARFGKSCFSTIVAGSLLPHYTGVEFTEKIAPSVGTSDGI